MSVALTAENGVTLPMDAVSIVVLVLALGLTVGWAWYLYQ
jgi:hypothetical protein